MGTSVETTKRINLVADGDMEAGDTSAWTVGAGTLSKQTTDPVGGSRCMRITEGAVLGSAAQSVTENTRDYEVYGYARSDGTSTPILSLDGGSTTHWTGTTSTSWQEISAAAANIGGTGLVLGAISGGEDTYCDFDEVILHETSTYEMTLDKSGGGNHFTLGDGKGTGDPPFNDPGFEFDGTSSDYLEHAHGGIFNSAKQTIVIGFRPDFASDEDALRYLYDTPSGSRYALLKRDSGSSYTLGWMMGNTGMTSIAQATYGPYWRTGGNNVLVISGTSGSTKVWLNRYKLLTDTTAWSAADPASVQLGIVSGKSGNRFDGSIFHFSTAPVEIGVSTVREITDELLRGAA
jgi:hypothetical protein